MYYFYYLTIHLIWYSLSDDVRLNNQQIVRISFNQINVVSQLSNKLSQQRSRQLTIVAL